MGGTEYSVVAFKNFSSSATGDAQCGSYSVPDDGQMIVTITNVGGNRWPAVWVDKNGTRIFKQDNSKITVDSAEASAVLPTDATHTHSWCKFRVKKGDTITYGSQSQSGGSRSGCFWLIM